jgi:DNA-binding GntR family transcriptional regulator
LTPSVDAFRIWNSEFQESETLLIEPLDQTGLVDRVYDRLVAAIAEGTLPPGKPLRQDEVANLLGVSRQPVSHALQLVKRQKLAVEHGRKGLAVAPLVGSDVRDLYQVRGALDGLAARLAACRARALPDDERAAAEEALEAGQSLGEGTPVGALIRADVAFHNVLYRLSGNLSLFETVAPQWPHFMRAMGASLEIPGKPAVVWAEHALILERILAGDPKGAAKAATEHAERAGMELGARIASRSSTA